MLSRVVGGFNGGGSHEKTRTDECGRKRREKCTSTRINLIV